MSDLTDQPIENDGYYVLIVTPLLISWTVSYFTGKTDPYKYSPAWFQPPGWVFGVVWTFLYVMFGLLLFESIVDESYTVLGLVIAILFLTYFWQYLFNYKKLYKYAVYDLLAILILSLMLYYELIKKIFMILVNLEKVMFSYTHHLLRGLFLLLSCLCIRVILE